ncbi:MAG: imidazole glycerol phosphate synthase subunit HisF [Armatimonadetes bacterium]|nr:imidazole glycerol phosphate synthase subunit HisF [Armatimonadota bacterium]
MFRPRVIPVLLLRNGGLVKTTRFGKPTYVGDPINAVRIFNDLEADELIFLDIMASREKRVISLDFVREVGEEANMPFAVGGGIRTLEDIRAILGAGAEKVVLNTVAAENPDFIAAAADTFGSSTVVVCMDVKKPLLGKLQTWAVCGTQATGRAPEEFARLAADKGAGEIIVQSIERDGTMQGYDIPLVRSIAEAVPIPVVALGGAGGLHDLLRGRSEGLATAVAAGSMFVFHGPRRGVLITYPERSEMAFQ